MLQSVPVTGLICVAVISSLLGGCGARDGLENLVGIGVASDAGSAATNLAGFGGRAPTSPTEQLCGPSNATCRASEYCGYPLGNCRSAADSGSCVARPIECSQRYMPVCACDGRPYDNSCLAQASGADLATSGSCVIEAALANGWLPCGGSSAANPQLAYCEISRSARDGITDFNGNILPPACMAQASSANASCACFPKDTPCLEGCTVTRVGSFWAFTLICAQPR